MLHTQNKKQIECDCFEEKVGAFAIRGNSDTTLEINSVV